MDLSMTAQTSSQAFERLLNIMNDLREKCPWDKKQTMDSLRYLSLEEMYELSDAILEGNSDEIRGELGDILLHITFYAKIASEQGRFDITDVLNGICEKLIARHPHIYAGVRADSEEEVKRNWEKLKLKEGKKSTLEGVPKSLPALIKAMRIQEKAKGAGFDWEHEQDVWNKVREEIDEFRTETLPEKRENKERMTEEFGDVLFSLINYARFLNINAEDALEHTNRKFIKRFRYMEEQLAKQGKMISEVSLQEADRYWEEAKKVL